MTPDRPRGPAPIADADSRTPTAKTFDDLGLVEPLREAIRAKGYTIPTPIQLRAIPHLLAGRDLLGVAQTGTGKTAAFALPMLQRLDDTEFLPEPQRPRALVLTPTRELASQVEESFASYGRNLDLTHAVIFGGVGQAPQERALRAGVDVLVATPGRLLDLMSQRLVDLRDVEIFVLDEADRMLDMGFLPDVKRVLAVLPKERQSILFSATMPEDIVQLAARILRDPIRVEVTPPATTVERIRQSVYFVAKADKRALLGVLLQDATIERVLVFTRTKHGADRVVKHLKRLGETAEAIHGDKSQSNREKALENFRAGKTRVLVATDIAARGIDVPGITHVVNFDLPNVSESYVHRIGRTARAGKDGIAVAFCDGDERELLHDIEKLIRRKIPVVPTPILPESTEPAPESHRRGPPPRAPRSRAPAASKPHSSNPHASKPTHAKPNAQAPRSGGRRSFGQDVVARTPTTPGAKRGGPRGRGGRRGRR